MRSILNKFVGIYLILGCAATVFFALTFSNSPIFGFPLASTPSYIYDISRLLGDSGPTFRHIMEALSNQVLPTTDLYYLCDGFTDLHKKGIIPINTTLFDPIELFLQLFIFWTGLSLVRGTQIKLLRTTFFLLLVSLFFRLFDIGYTERHIQLFTRPDIFYGLKASKIGACMTIFAILVLWFGHLRAQIKKS